MPFCPRCHFEYDSTELMCVTCHEVLVDQLAVATKVVSAVRPDESWVVVEGISDRVLTRLAKGSLDSNNIPAMVLPAYLTALGDGATRTKSDQESTDGELIMVPREFLDDASLLLRTVLGDGFGENKTDLQ